MYSLPEYLRKILLVLPTVDGRNPANQLRLVVYPTIFAPVWDTSQVVFSPDFFPQHSVNSMSIFQHDEQFWKIVCQSGGFRQIFVRKVWWLHVFQDSLRWKNYVWKWQFSSCNILLMEEVNRKPPGMYKTSVNSRVFTISTGAGFFASTVAINVSLI